MRYDDSVASHYPAARAVSRETADTWVAILSMFLPRSSPATVLDLGCGTGRFATLFAERFQAQIVALDPAVAMLRAATQATVPGNLFYLGARSEGIPLADASCEVAWLSQMIHHVSDRKACACELRRVLRRGGHVLIRGTFGDRLDGCPDLFHFFPGARAFAAQFPAIDQVTADFRSAGFSFEKLQRVSQKTCDDLAQLAGRTRLRADSTLRLLPDVEYERCQAELDRAARAARSPKPVIETLDLLVMQAPAD